MARALAKCICDMLGQCERLATQEDLLCDTCRSRSHIHISRSDDTSMSTPFGELTGFSFTVDDATLTFDSVPSVNYTLGDGDTAPSSEP